MHLWTPREQLTMRFSASIAVAAVLTAGCYATPQVKIGKTTVAGRDIPTLKQEFFGGE